MKPYKTSLILAISLFSAGAYAQTNWVTGLGAYAKSIKRSRFAWYKLVAQPSAVHKRAEPPRVAAMSGTAVVNSDSAPAANGLIKSVSVDPTLYVPVGNGSFRLATPEEERRDIEAVRARLREATRGADLMLKGKEREGRSIIYGLMRERPADPWGPEELAKACAKLGQYDEALALFAPSLGPDSSSDMLLFAAYAGAMSGHVFEGQKEYTDRIPREAAASLRCWNGIPSGNTLSAARESAALALAIKYQNGGYDQEAIPFLRVADRLNPKNPLTLYSLGQIYRRQKDYRLAAEVLGRATRCSTGLLRDWAQRDYEAAKYSRDCERATFAKASGGKD